MLTKSDKSDKYHWEEKKSTKIQKQITSKTKSNINNRNNAKILSHNILNRIYTRQINVHIITLSPLLREKRVKCGIQKKKKMKHLE